MAVDKLGLADQDVLGFWGGERGGCFFGGGGGGGEGGGLLEGARARAFWGARRKKAPLDAAAAAAPLPLPRVRVLGRQCSAGQEVTLEGGKGGPLPRRSVITRRTRTPHTHSPPPTPARAEQRDAAHHAERLERALQVALHRLCQVARVVGDALALKADGADLGVA